MSENIAEVFAQYLNHSRIVLYEILGINRWNGINMLTHPSIAQKSTLREFSQYQNSFALCGLNERCILMLKKVSIHRNRYKVMSRYVNNDCARIKVKEQFLVLPWLLPDLWFIFLNTFSVNIRMFYCIMMRGLHDGFVNTKMHVSEWCWHIFIIMFHLMDWRLVFSANEMNRK